METFCHKRGHNAAGLLLLIALLKVKIVIDLYCFYTSNQRELILGTLDITGIVCGCRNQAHFSEKKPN